MRTLLLTLALAVGLLVVPSLAHGAIDNEVAIRGYQSGGLASGVTGFDSFSKSFVVEQLGYANMAVVTVPEGDLWEVRTARATNCSDEPQALSFKITDQDGTTFMSMPEGPTPVMVPPGGTLSWSGEIVIPASWRVYAEWHDLDGSGCTNNAQVTSLVVGASGEGTSGPTLD